MVRQTIKIKDNFVWTFYCSLFYKKNNEKHLNRLNFTHPTQDKTFMQNQNTQSYIQLKMHDVKLLLQTLISPAMTTARPRPSSFFIYFFIFFHGDTWQTYPHFFHTKSIIEQHEYIQSSCSSNLWTCASCASFHAKPTIEQYIRA